MRWNHLILALLGVCILSKSVHSFVDTVYVPGTADGDLGDWNLGEETTPNFLNVPEIPDGNGDPSDNTNSGPLPVETTEKPVDNGGNQKPPALPWWQTDDGKQKTTAEAPINIRDLTQAPAVDGQQQETTPEYSGPEDSETTPEPEDPAQPTDASAIIGPVPVATDAPEVEKTTPEPENPSTEPADLTDAPSNEVETTPEDTVEETTEYVEETTEDSSGDETSELPVHVETTVDPWAVPVPPGGSGTGGVNQPGLSTTEAADVESTTDIDLSYQQNMANAKAVPQGPWGNGKVYSTIAPSVRNGLDWETETGYKPDVLPGKILLNTLTDEYVVIDGLDDWSKVVANKNGYFVLHPVQTTGNNVIFDPYTIGQVLGYIYEFQEFNGQPPADGWTINLMNKPIPQPVRRKRSGGVKSRRATLVFTKKADVVAKEEEHDYWKKVIASI
ncbi:hypothetical protein CAEBREN_25703 [Caenorhabditis brenneri]|uniref:Uncharacterized protein n=1 Tax=Caenorhabditis brenneri TaxID=135651 RepID=G0N2H0_CAEBE|nr:hypothetical protein CAEBREN_25703 [Caenorhabditis brenneri]